MKTKSTFLVPLLLLGALLAAAPATTAARWHFGLRQSVPAKDASVPAPEEVRLWFTQVPQENSVAIRLVDPAGDAVETSEPKRDPDDGTVVFVTFGEKLPAGTYTVAWRGIGDDGHVVRGDFAFSVAAQ